MSEEFKEFIETSEVVDICQKMEKEIALLNSRLSRYREALEEIAKNYHRGKCPAYHSYAEESLCECFRRIAKQALEDKS